MYEKINGCYGSKHFTLYYTEKNLRKSDKNSKIHSSQKNILETINSLFKHQIEENILPVKSYFILQGVILGHSTLLIKANWVFRSNKAITVYFIQYFREFVLIWIPMTSLQAFIQGVTLNTMDLVFYLGIEYTFYCK